LGEEQLEDRLGQELELERQVEAFPPISVKSVLVLVLL
jgi:hypothetical protein